MFAVRFEDFFKGKGAVLNVPGLNDIFRNLEIEAVPYAKVRYASIPFDFVGWFNYL